MTTEDYLLILGWIAFSILIRLAALSGYRWVRILLGVAAAAGTATLFRYAQTSFDHAALGLMLTGAFLIFSIWLAKYWLRLFRYIFRVLRGAAIQARVKADKLAETE